jgi:hypothetical protein
MKCDRGLVGKLEFIYLFFRGVLIEFLKFLMFLNCFDILIL